MSGLTVSEAGELLSRECGRERECGRSIEYAVCSPDLWNRRQDTGYSGYEIMTRLGIPNLIKADNRRIPGWRTLRDRLRGKLFIFRCCEELIRSLESLQCDKNIPEDASDTPHSITHAPEALRYAVMSRAFTPSTVSCDRTASIFKD